MYVCLHVCMSVYVCLYVWRLFCRNIFRNTSGNRPYLHGTPSKDEKAQHFVGQMLVEYYNDQHHDNRHDSKRAGTAKSATHSPETEKRIKTEDCSCSCFACMLPEAFSLKC